MPEAGSDAPQRRRRPRTTKESIRDSVYLVPPSALSRHALGAALAARAVPPRRAADSAREDEDAESFRVRALDGWETRRQREKALAEFIGSSDDPGPRLPDDDLLMAVHLHAAKTYERSGLLVPPKKRSRAQPWASKKRRLVDAQKDIATISSAPLAGASSSAGGSGSAGLQAATERAERRSRTMTRRTRAMTKSRTRMDGKDHGMDAEDEDGDEEQDGIRHRSEEQSQDSDEGEVDGEGEGEDESEDDSVDDNEGEGEGNHGANDNDDGTARSQTNTESSQRRRAYKRRDMYRAFDGSALLALGILVEEYIIAQLHQAGYQPRRDRRDDHSDHHPDDQPRGTGLGPRGTGPTAPDAPRRLSPSDSDDANHADAAPLDSLGQASGASDHDESSNDAYDDIRNHHDDESNDDHDGGSSVD